jgi:hypothetical protein
MTAAQGTEAEDRNPELLEKKQVIERTGPGSHRAVLAAIWGWGRH